jgi:predicted DCC family thiol-disulfide oxidoreductase YuxK
MRHLLLKNGWTGGQYSLFRASFGLCLALHFALHRGSVWFGIPPGFGLHGSSAADTLLLIGACAVSLAFAAGWRDRWMALVVCGALACLHAWDLREFNPWRCLVVIVLVLHACLPPKPFGSFDARGRVDPNGGWTFPRGIHCAAWVTLALGYCFLGASMFLHERFFDGTILAHILRESFARPTFLREWLLALPSGCLKLVTWTAIALEFAFLPLALYRLTRPWIWLALLCLQLASIALFDSSGLFLGMVMVHFFTFDPGWIAGRGARSVERVYYDGHCGLCHRTVRFLLAEDVDGSRFRFAALQGATCAARIAPERRAELPDSVVVETADGKLLVKSAAVLHLLARLGGLWRVLGAAGSIVPRGVRDLAYDGVARIRLRLFAAPAEACPLSPPALRERFDP